MEYGVTSLNPQAQYQKVAEAFGGKGYDVKTVPELHKVCKQLFVDANKKKLIVVNVHIEPSSQKKPQDEAWLTRKAPNPKL